MIRRRRSHTRTELLKCMNSITSFLVFTAETEEDFPEEEGYLPTLDTKLMLTANNRITYRFFEKKMSSKTVS